MVIMICTCLQDMPLLLKTLLLKVTYRHCLAEVRREGGVGVLIFIPDWLTSQLGLDILRHWLLQVSEEFYQSDGNISERDYESVVLMKLCQFEERKRLIREMEEEEKRWQPSEGSVGNSRQGFPLQEVLESRFQLLDK